jgi:hypothetical protein
MLGVRKAQVDQNRISSVFWGYYHRLQIFESRTGPLSCFATTNSKFVTRTSKVGSL